MITPLFKRAHLLFAGILTTLLASPVFAQQTGEQPSKAPEASQPMPSLQPQPTTVPGRPDIPNAEVAKQLRNVAPLPSAPQRTICQPHSSRFPMDLESTSLRAASPTPAPCVSATKEPYLSATACSTKFTPSSKKTANVKIR